MNKGKILAVVGGGLLVGLILIIYYFGSVFTPVVIAFILAYLCNPVVSLLERRRVPRPLATLIVFIMALALVTSCGWLFISLISDEFSSVRINLPEYTDRLYRLIPHDVKVRLDIETPEKVYYHLNEALDRLKGVSADVAKEAFLFVSHAFTSTLSFVLALLSYFIIPVYLYYLLQDLPQMRSALEGLVPYRFRPSFNARLNEINDTLSAFVRGQLLVCAILAILYSIGLYIIGIDLAILIGTLAGAAFIIPYLGTILGITLSMLMAVLKFHDLLHPLLCLGWFVVVQGLEGGIITPKIVGNKVGLNPVVALLSLLIAGQAFGILGMLLAIPTAATVKILIRAFIEWYRESEFFRGGA